MDPYDSKTYQTPAPRASLQPARPTPGIVRRAMASAPPRAAVAAPRGPMAPDTRPMPAQAPARPAVGSGAPVPQRQAVPPQDMR